MALRGMSSTSITTAFGCWRAETCRPRSNREIYAESSDGVQDGHDDQLMRLTCGFKNFAPGSEQGSAARRVGLSVYMDGDYLRSPPGFFERFQDFHGRYSSHQQSQLTFKRCLNGFAVDPLDVFGTGCANPTHLHKKFGMFHDLPAGSRPSGKGCLRRDECRQRFLCRQSPT